MTNPTRSSGRFTSLRTLRWSTAIAVALISSGANSLRAQNSTVGIQMVPVTLTVPQLRLTAPQGSTNVLEVSTNLTAWQDVTTVVFTSTNMLWLDLYPRGNAAYYRLRRVIATGQPPFPAPLTNFIWIPAGQFVMGSPETDTDADGDELPQTSVTLTKGFFIGKFEVTQGEYVSLVGGNPSQFVGDTNLPVDSVRWTDATNYCRLLNLRESAASRLPAGYAYRLPTEAEWEYAARAGASTRFNWGNDPSYTALTNYAWFDANSSLVTHPVGQKLPNAWGLYDTAGNVCEWTLNSFNAVDSYPGGTVVDPIASAPGASKVFRGGGHADDAISCRPASRNNVPQNLAVNIFGFRVVLAQTP